jgi:hypothetical protein
MNSYEKENVIRALANLDEIHEFFNNALKDLRSLKMVEKNPKFTQYIESHVNSVNKAIECLGLALHGENPHPTKESTHD